MRKVKYIPVGKFGNNNLTPSKVYDVIKYIPSKYKQLDQVMILNDEGVVINRRLNRFEDVTSEYRSEIIDNILM